MHKNYKKLLFDLDNTLVDDDENRKYAIRQVLLDRKEVATKEEMEYFNLLKIHFRQKKRVI